ncbi:MAG TPA: hypothetical protein DCP92_09780 [Nitrospiraceae bacterium]|nr:hypothetical protein [Nitrospiraceae bacterium]
MTAFHFIGRCLILIPSALKPASASAELMEGTGMPSFWPGRITVHAIAPESVSTEMSAKTLNYVLWLQAFGRFGTAKEINACR